MIVDASYSVAVLHALGAVSVSPVYGEDEELIGYQVDPTIDLSGYAEAAAQQAAGPAAPLRVDASHDLAALHALGATRIMEARDENGALMGYDVFPDIDLSDYAAALAEVLAEVKATVTAEVNAAAEAERKRYITAGEGQAMTYTEKLAQARAFLAASAPDPADYPMIANEVGITAPDAAGVAEAVVAAYSAWAAIGAAIEKTRMEANKAIAAALDAPAARAVRNNIVWPTGV